MQPNVTSDMEGLKISDLKYFFPLQFCIFALIGTGSVSERMSNSQWYPLKLCLIKYELDINVYNF